jgi:predicted CoA-substrate-specific enzyme activase
MFFAGIDVGGGTTKCALLNEKKLVSRAVIPTGGIVARGVDEVFSLVLGEAGISAKEVAKIVSTGSGRRAVSFADEMVTEIICHAKGASFLLPQARLVIDIGCQDSKIIRLNENGNVIDFAMNDKCAAGTGRFLEVVARALEVELEQLGEMSLASQAPCQMSSTCTVFAESEIIALRNQGEKLENLIAGALRAIASRVAIMGSQVGITGPIVFTGGVAKNKGVKTALEEKIGVDIHVPPDPQIIGALGAALLAAETAGRKGV